jgi:maltooligosyltrehalose trehalohydrolase
MKRHHAMPFGAEWHRNSGTRFRLWAPGARRVALILGDAEGSREFEPVAEEEGWFAATVGDAGPDTRYAYRIDDGLVVPDPASRCNPDDVHSPSMVVDPRAYDWKDKDWIGRPWEDAVIYEMHIGAFTEEGTFAAAIGRLDHLVDVGVTCLEVMPVVEFPGRWNWGYDGVLLFAPEASYGSPDDLKRFVDAAHARGLMLLLDVVYNHFGPDGNYLHTYAPQFFNARHHTPWGAAINFDGERNRTVRDFYIHNALFWLEEYRFDGLRMDAVDRIADDSTPDILTELTARVRQRFDAERHVHIVLENDRNQARYLGRNDGGRPIGATAQWTDDIHHAAHVLITGETDGYYVDYKDDPLWYFGRGLAEGFAYQGETSVHRGNVARGERSVGLPPGAFVTFLQTHDQVGNRALGERLVHQSEPRALRMALACVLLAPPPPLLFMGEEFAASSPFLFFCDFSGNLADAVTRGRRHEFGRFERFRDPASQQLIPDPNKPSTFEMCKLHWDETTRAPHDEWLRFYRHLLHLRAEHVVPHLNGAHTLGTFEIIGSTVLSVDWALADGVRLHLRTNVDAARSHRIPRPSGEMFFSTDAHHAESQEYVLPPRSTVWHVETATR